MTASSADRAGHLVAEGWVGRQYSDRDADAHDRVTLSIPVDASTLGRDLPMKTILVEIERATEQVVFGIEQFLASPLY